MKPLPIPVSFQLPSDDWAPASPESRGVDNAAFLALRSGLPGTYQPSIVVSGDVRESADVTDVANEEVALLAGEAGTPVTVRERRVFESASAPGLFQWLTVTTEIDGKEQDLDQLQVVTAYGDTAPAAVVVHTLSCLAEQTKVVGAEFRKYVGSIRVE